jgi:hypothetical protein
MGDSREVSILREENLLLTSAGREAKLIEVIGELALKIDEMNDKLAEIKEELVEIKNNTSA